MDMMKEAVKIYPYLDFIDVTTLPYSFQLKVHVMDYLIAPL